MGTPKDIELKIADTEVSDVLRDLKDMPLEEPKEDVVVAGKVGAVEEDAMAVLEENPEDQIESAALENAA